MDSNRRDFLKLFGVGCAIVPIIGGAPVVAAESKLIEVPKVEPVATPSLYGVGKTEFMNGPQGITVIMEDPLTGKRTTLIGKTFVMHQDWDLAEVRSRYRPEEVRAQYVKSKRMVWRLEGEFIADEKGNIGQMIQEYP